MNWTNGIKGGPFDQSQISHLEGFLAELSSGQIQWLSGYFSALGTVLATNETDETQNDKIDQHSEEDSLYILYGTQTGNSEKLAASLLNLAKKSGVKANVCNIGRLKHREFKNIKRLALIISTQGLGEPPVQAEDFYNFLQSNKAPDLTGLKYSVLALGDSSYPNFCQTGKDFDTILEKLGGKRLQPRIDCDVDYEEEASDWMHSLINELQSHQILNPTLDINSIPAKSLILDSSSYSKKNPYESEVLEKIILNGKGSTKENVHLELDIDSSKIKYYPGDSLGVIALNSEEFVDNLLNTVNIVGNEVVQTHNGQKTIKEALIHDFELRPLSSSTVSRYAELTENNELLSLWEDNKKIPDFLKGKDVIDLLCEYPAELTAQSLITILRKNSARMYSIASSQSAYPDEVHLLVSILRYNLKGRTRGGMCSTFISDTLEIGNKVKIYVETNTRFRLPADHSAPIIMIGPGTGIAPFRAFMQQRECDSHPGKSWLFFGERNFVTDFFYQTEWQQYLEDGILTKLDVAFSRDSETKQYVQHKMLDNGEEIYNWLEDGAYIYVCGEAQKMAKDVHNILINIIQEHAGISLEDAEEYLKYLEVNERYQRDVY